MLLLTVIRQKLWGTEKLKVLNYIASYQGACLFLSYHNRKRSNIVFLKNLPIFKKFLKTNKFKILNTFPVKEKFSIVCWGSYSRDLFLIKYLNKKNISLKIRSASLLTNMLFRQKKLSVLKTFSIFKTVLYFYLNNIFCDFKKYDGRVFYCVPPSKIKKFVPYIKKERLNKKFLMFLKKNYKTKIRQFKKIKEKKILLIDVNSKKFHEAKNNMNKSHKIIIKNHPHSASQQAFSNAFIIPKEIPFEYCEKLFGLNNVHKISFIKNSSLFEK